MYIRDTHHQDLKQRPLSDHLDFISWGEQTRTSTLSRLIFPTAATTPAFARPTHLPPTCLAVCLTTTELPPPSMLPTYSPAFYSSSRLGAERTAIPAHDYCFVQAHSRSATDVDASAISMPQGLHCCQHCFRWYCLCARLRQRSCRFHRLAVQAFDLHYCRCS